MGHNLGSYEGCTQYVPSDMRPFLFEFHISFFYIFVVEDMMGHEFRRHLEMCVVTFDLPPFILNNGTVSGEMRS